MEKRDYKKIYRDLYTATDNEIKNINVPKLNYLTITGESDIDSEFYRKAIKTLYDLSYNLKFNIRDQSQIDYIVMPLEALLDNNAKKQWTLMIMQPDIVNEQIFLDELNKLKETNNDLLLNEVKFIVYDEQNCLQILHRGPYNEQSRTIKLIRNEITNKKLQPIKVQHEIYLNNPQRVNGDKLKTIVRQSYIKN